MSNELSAYAYVRCSTHEQAESGLSLEGQRARIQAWCEASGALLKDVIEDPGVSGGKPLCDRPGGRRVLELLDSRSPAATALVVVRLDRLGRDAAESLGLLKRFAEGKVGLVSITERLDLTTPQGRAMAGVAAVFAELERSLIGQRTSEALAQLRANNKVYGPIPFGLDAVDGLLVRNDSEQETLNTMRDLRDLGHSYAVIAARLTGLGRPTKRGGPWYAMSVRSVLLTARQIDGTAADGLAAQPS